MGDTETAHIELEIFRMLVLNFEDFNVCTEAVTSMTAWPCGSNDYKKTEGTIYRVLRTASLSACVTGRRDFLVVIPLLYLCDCPLHIGL
jgi:hypothetical protein